MASFVMRVWLADRPGALGAIASRIGAVGGDLVGIDILERGDGRVIDELTIDLPGEELIPLMLAKVAELDAVDVEDVRSVVAGLPYPLVDALEVGADLLGARSVGDLFDSLVAGVGTAYGAEWATVVDPEGPVVLSSSEGAPPGPWLEAFVMGTRSAAKERGAAASASDVAWAGLEVSGLALLVGRTGRPFRARERRQLATLARIADHRWRELVTLDGMRAHPARSN
ncbi:MAG: hypothetical protein JWO62_2693 [Acidimicrobiaceae bacterium]|jgi:hypothetical protein|nr:hypothetical protein [Acidimicrobiaceae bacterium]